MPAGPRSRRWSRASPDHLTACRRWEELRAAPGSGSAAAERRATTTSARRQARWSWRPATSRNTSRSPGWGCRHCWRRERPVVRAVDDMSVRVRGGFTMGIVGESGCGKTTFARCIAGLEEADRGRNRAGGHPPALHASPGGPGAAEEDPDGVSEPRCLAEPAVHRGAERRPPACSSWATSRRSRSRDGCGSCSGPSTCRRTTSSACRTS